MKRKAIIGIITVLSLLVLGSIFYYWHIKKSRVTGDALRAIPTDASLLIKINDFGQLQGQLINNNEFWQVLGGFKLISDTDRCLKKAENLKRQSTVFEGLVFSNHVFLSIHAVGKGTPSPLFVANIPERIKPADVLNFVRNEVGEYYSDFNKEYNGARIYTFSKKNADKPETFSISIHNRIVMFSPSLLLVEAAIGQLGSSFSLLEEGSFVEALKTAGTRVPANIFINHGKLPAILSQQVNSNHRGGVSDLAHLASWTELDLSVKKDAFYLNGFTQTSDTLNAFFQVFSKQKPVKMNIPSVLPAQTAALIYLGISDINTYFTSYEKYLEGRGRLFAYKQQVDKMGKSIDVNLQTFYSSVFGKELALAFIPFDGEDYGNSWFVVAEIKSQSSARQLLLSIIETYSLSTGRPSASYERTFSIDRDKSVKIYQMPVQGLHQTLFGSLFSNANDNFFTFIDSYIVFGSSVESLSRLILANVHNKQLALEESFRNFSLNLSQESNFTAYISPGKAEIVYGQVFAPSSAARLLSRMEVLQKIQGAAIQLTGGRSMIFNNVCASYSPNPFDAPKTVWETRLDTSISIKPQLVINHNTQNREIFVQDNNNNIYLINEVGRVLWKRPLTEKIFGEVNQVDIFRNGRLQLLFNTKSHLHLVDRNGNNVDGFPVKLRAQASNPVAVFDYEGNRDYRFFIAGVDRKIYAYDRNGNVVTGWDFDRSEKQVSKPIQHFRVDGRDYIVFADENRPYILDRRGNERLKPKQHFSQALNSTFVLDDRSGQLKPRLVTTDTLGVVRLLYFDGNVEDVAVKRVSSLHAFDYADVNGNGQKDFIFIDKNQLHVIKNKGGELFSQKFDHNLMPQIIYFHFGARDRKLGVVCSVSSQIYLINGDGSLYKGFPLLGNTPFSIGQFANTKSTFNLIVGSSSGFVLNYAVQ